jgi:hypothetical protein
MAQRPNHVRHIATCNNLLGCELRGELRFKLGCELRRKRLAGSRRFRFPGRALFTLAPTRPILLLIHRPPAQL